MKTLLLLIVSFGMGCHHALPPEDYKIVQTFKKFDQNNQCKVITEETK